MIKELLSFSKSFYNRALCSFPILLSGSQESVRFLRPVARQNIGKPALRMIVKGANCYYPVIIVSQLDRVALKMAHANAKRCLSNLKV